MNRRRIAYAKKMAGVPRRRGDEPIDALLGNIKHERSPQARG